MNRKQALAKLRPILGSKMGYREDYKAAIGEEREQLLAANIARQQRKQAAKAALDARRVAVLAADPEYRALSDEYAALSAECEAAPSAYARRITVGVMSSLFFSVRAEGDTWAEVVEKVTSKTTKTP